MLMDPAFLFRVERDPAGIAPNTAYKISDIELASRLSFFLWSSIPDDQLLTARSTDNCETPRYCRRRYDVCWPISGPKAW